MSIYYALPQIIEASEEVGRVYAQTMANHDHSIQVLQANQAHFESKAAGAFAHAITVVNNAYQQAATDIQMAGHAVAQAAANGGHADAISAAQYGGA